jgi:hypothetical protein
MASEAWFMVDGPLAGQLAANRANDYSLPYRKESRNSQSPQRGRSHFPSDMRHGNTRPAIELRRTGAYKPSMPQAGRFAFEFNAGPLVSVFAHAIILALLVFGLPRLPLDAQEPPAIEVELAAPIEELPPEPQKQPQKKPGPAPTPQSKPQLKPAPQSKPALQSRPAQSQAARGEQAKPRPPAMMRPVLKFGEKDAGTRKPVDDKVQAAPKAAAPAARQEAIRQAGPPRPNGTAAALPGVAAPAPAGKPTAETGSAGKTRSQPGEKDEAATTAMGDLPRASRAGQLCVTELRLRLNNSNPPYWPDLLPAYRLAKGNVLQVRKGAFRANGRWYNLGFRCEVDEGATVVVSLEFEVGAPVPRAEWATRGFPQM